MSNLYETYKGKNVLVTGGTGFKGSWLCLWLMKLGANVTSIARNPPTDPSHFNILELGKNISDVRFDLKEQLNLDKIRPDIVFHLAASAIVAKTFEEPRETFENNIMATVNLLDACRLSETVKAIVIITSDKIYKSREWNWAYRENDAMGDSTPYGASKVCVEQVVECYKEHYFPMIAVARAGNVLGGADWGEKRLIPDIVRATRMGIPVKIHTPTSTRPWQFVLEPLMGYLLLGEKLLQGNQRFAKPFNFGPQGEMTVLEVLQTAKEVWPVINWEIDNTPTHPGMVYLLKIDSTESRKLLGWEPRWSMKYAVARSIRWYKEYYETGKILTTEDIEDYCGGENT